MIEAIKTRVFHAAPAIPENQPLPDYAILYFEHLAGEYGSIPQAELDSEIKSIAEKIFSKEKDKALTWRDLYTFDLVLTRKLPIEKLARKVWSLRSRYRDVAGLKEYEAYLASKPPDLAATAQDEAAK